ncbi:MAG: GTPase HflX [Hydrogenophilales bacterium 28-61-23]|nr:MAG: GTPase HflX [Hydrogenophilales bacterium 28-61-23]
MQREVKDQPQYAIAAAVQLPGVSDVEFEASLTELRELAKTLGFKVTRTFTQKRNGFDRAAYLGIGKRQEIRHFVNNEADDETASELASPNFPPRLSSQDEAWNDADAQVSAEQIDILFVDHEISPSQARNLEKEVGCQVMDRTMVILEIFHRNARSPAARAQVEIARIGYMAPRLREAAKLAGPQGRQRSGVGGRGAGESHTELDKRKLRDRIAELQKEIIAMDADRKTQRARRQANQGLASVALVGYTNAGKSTLMRALTGSEVLVADKLFATLDTTVRSLYPESIPRVLVSDTVGFIKNLPHGLVASFKSTLEEALDASLLLHVIDASDPGFERQRETTDEVLKEINAQDVPRIRVFNKIDHVGDAAAQAECEAALRASYPDCIVMSAKRPDDIAKLHQAIVAFFQRDQVEAELFLPWSAQQLRGEIFARCEVLAEHADDAGAFFRVRGDPLALDSLRQQLGQAR